MKTIRSVVGQRAAVYARRGTAARARTSTKRQVELGQVADRWHLMENASRGFLDAVHRSMPQVREVVGAATIDPALLTASERIQYEGYLRREEADAAIHALAEAGVPIRRICQRLGHSRKVVRAVLRGERTDVFRNATELWRRAKGQGFRSSLRVVGEWATRRRRAEQA